MTRSRTDFADATSVLFLHHIPVTGAKALVYAGGLLVSKACERSNSLSPSGNRVRSFWERSEGKARLHRSASPSLFFYPLTVHGIAAAWPAAPADDAEERSPGRRFDTIIMPGALSRQNATRLLFSYWFFLRLAAFSLTCFLASRMPLRARRSGAECRQLAMCSPLSPLRSRSASPPRRLCPKWYRASTRSGPPTRWARSGSR